MSEENKIQNLPLGLYWKDKCTTVERTVLPFQNQEIDWKATQKPEVKRYEDGILTCLPK